MVAQDAAEVLETIPHGTCECFISFLIATFSSSGAVNVNSFSLISLSLTLTDFRNNG